MENTPIIETERLLLRRFTKQDVNALFTILRDKETSRFLPMFPLKTQKEAELFLQEHYLNSYFNPIGFRYAICFKEDQVPIGYVNISNDESFDLGYGLLREFWHQGIATEAASAIVAMAKTEEIPYITATHDVDNPGSGQVMRKLGMRYQYTYQEQWQPILAWPNSGCTG